MSHIPPNLSSKLKEVSDNIIGDVIGLSQAMDLLRKDLEQLSAQLDARRYEQAAQMGYESLSSNFVFLQRCLGGIQAACADRDSVIQEMAGLCQTSFEEEKPEVYAAMEAMQLNPDKPHVPPTYTDDELYHKSNVPMNGKDERAYMAVARILRGCSNWPITLVAIKCSQALMKRADKGDEEAQLMVQVVERCKDPSFLEDTIRKHMATRTAPPKKD
jgi:hypothetical protein